MAPHILPPYIPIQRTYLHFDAPVNDAVATLITSDPAAVAKHAFYPFIKNDVVTQKIKRAPGGGVIKKAPKIRIIAYCAHKDAHFFAYYSYLLVQLYEAELRRRGLHPNITAFRSIDGQRNIHFANDVFEFIKRLGRCAVLAADVSDYFGTINHALLKKAWCQLLGVDRLPDDHFAIFQAITKYCQVDVTELCRALGLDPERPRPRKRHRYCTPEEFRELVRGAGLCETNWKGSGIPQGSPISALLSNLYLLEFDTQMQSFAQAHGGLYRRYCDDILLVLPTVAQRAEAQALMLKLLAGLALVAHPDKTEVIDFCLEENRLVASKTLNYLGFTFDGVHKRIRPASIARFYKKMRAGVARAKVNRWKLAKKDGRSPTPLRTKQLYIRYTYLGRHNFISYALKATEVMKDDGIKKQVKAHWKRLQQLINSY